MAIRPITSVNFSTVSNNNIAFESRKDKHSRANNSARTAAMTIPLATLIAMSPLNTQAANRLEIEREALNKTELVLDKAAGNEKIVSTKTFAIDAGKNMIFNAVSTDGNSNNFEKIQIKWKMRSSSTAGYEDFELKGVTKLNYAVVGDDGNTSVDKSSLMRLSLVGSSGKYSGRTVDVYMNEDMEGYVESLLADKRNNTGIIQKTYTNKLRPTTEFQLQNVPNGNITKNAKPYTPALKNIGGKEFECSNGVYKFNYFTLDNNEDDMEMLTLKLPDGSELACMGIYRNTALFSNVSDTPKKFVFDTIKLIDGDGKTYMITDEILFAFLLNIAKLDCCNNAYEINNSEPVKYSVSPKGVVAPIQEVEDEDGDFLDFFVPSYNK